MELGVYSFGEVPDALAHSADRQLRQGSCERYMSGWGRHSAHTNRPHTSPSLLNCQSVQAANERKLRFGHLLHCPRLLNDLFEPTDRQRAR
jgi:hypothetical protein